jgi:predicted ATPase
VAIKFGLSNFKGFKKLEPIELKPLTVLCGINNSGKSSIIQSLLLMKQNVDSRQTTSDISDSIIFNGSYVQLGDWNDVIYGHATDNNKIGFTWHRIFDINQSKNDIEIDVKLGILSNINDKSTASEYEKKVLVSHFIFRHLQNNFSFALEKSDNEFYKLKLRGLDWVSFLFRFIYEFIYGDEFIAATNKAIKTQFFNNKLISEIVLEKVQVKFDGIAPTSLKIKDFAKQIHRVLTQIKNEKLNNTKGVPKSFYHFLDLTLSHLNTYLQQKSTSEKTTSKNIEEVAVLTMFTREKEISLFEVFPFYGFTARYLINLWSKMRYIGPLREAPKRFYWFDDWRNIYIGIKGENTPLVLAVEQEQKIPKYHRCIYEGKQIKEYELRESDQLLEALNWWLSECMKLPEITSVVGLIGGIPGQVKLNSSGIDVNLPDVGFGVSQILPILVECLRTREGETVVLEQPEIHLHPSLQSKLADFLICMAKSGKRLVVETHSEHLINRLCLRIAQEESGEIKDLLNTLFVSFDGKEQTSVVKPIEINEFGEIENWPVGFFDENDARELMAASLKKRMAKSKK